MQIIERNALAQAQISGGADKGSSSVSTDTSVTVNVTTPSSNS